MDPNELVPTPIYKGPGVHTMKELNQIPLRFLNIDEGVTMKTLGMVMELCRFGQIDFCSPEVIMKVTKKTSSTISEMEGEIPVTKTVEYTIISYILGVPTRAGSPIVLVCVRMLENRVTVSADVYFAVRDAIYLGDGENVEFSLDHIDKNDMMWLMENDVFSRARIMAESLNALLEGDYSIGKSALNIYETEYEDEGYTDEEAAADDAGAYHKGLYPTFWKKQDEMAAQKAKDESMSYTYNPMERFNDKKGEWE